jgi:hypothetical protein
MFFKKPSENKKSFLERLVGVETAPPKTISVKKEFVVPQEKVAPDGSGFFFSSGKEIKTIRELASELAQMSDEECAHYASLDTNHFANWVEGVFGEKELALKLRNAHGREAMRGILSVFVS